MARVLLVSLRSPFMDSDRVFPPIGLLQLQSCLIEAGHDVQVVDDFDPEDVPTVYSGFDVAGFSVMTPQGKDSIRALGLFKEAHPETVAVIGGPHATHYLADVEAQPWDFIVPADGERAIVKIADWVDAGREPGGLPRVIREQLRPDEMNATPLPARAWDFLGRYHYELDGLRTTTMLTTRGCPMGCRFCEDRRTTVRHYDIDRVVREIEEVKALGFGAVMFFDDIFLMIPKRTAELTAAIAPLGIKYRCFAHANTLREEMARQAAASGCVEIGFGCEHASQKILDVIGKGVKTSDNEVFLERCKRHGIRVKAFFIVGLPGENHETLAELEDFIARHIRSGALADFDLSLYFPYQGTYIRENLEEFDLQVTGDLDVALGYYKGHAGAAEAVVRTVALSAEELKDAKERIYKAYNPRFKARSATPAEADLVLPSSVRDPGSTHGA